MRAIRRVRSIMNLRQKRRSIKRRASKTVPIGPIVDLVFTSLVGRTSLAGVNLEQESLIDDGVA